MCVYKCCTREHVAITIPCANCFHESVHYLKKSKSFTQLNVFRTAQTCSNANTNRWDLKFQGKVPFFFQGPTTYILSKRRKKNMTNTKVCTSVLSLFTANNRPSNYFIPNNVFSWKNWCSPFPDQGVADKKR